MTLGYRSTAQTKQDFDAKLQNHIQSFLMDNQKVEKWKKENTATFIKLDPTENEDMLNNLVSELKHKYIIANMDEYKRAYFPEEFVASVMMTDTFICDNGGFESDFLYYKGYSTIYTSGSSICTPLNGSTPSVYVPATLPTNREFEIVTSGTDAITGLQKVKFGSKSLKLNDPYSHAASTFPDACEGDFGINKLVKRFKVTEENRDFTVWYSIAIENPTGHSNTQPFFNIKCDLAPFSELCFDAEILGCDTIYSQPNCGNNLMDVLDWTCHRIKIPATEVGNIATLEIVMGDCGLGGHNGYAYIDGICEGCSGSALGSLILSDAELDPPGIGIDYVSCHGDIARVCGRYTAPLICGEWYLDSIAGLEDTISNFSIDTSSKLFCFDVNKSNFGPMQDSLELYIAGFFKRESGGILPAVFSNTIKLKKSLYTKLFEVDYSVGECHDNGTSNNLSDDYYFVSVSQSLGGSEPWYIERHLHDPYDNESGITLLESGSGPFAEQLGPFLIQEGSWDLVVNIGQCTYIYTIYPPEFCSGCAAFFDMTIGNVSCVDPGTKWNFSVTVPGNLSTYSKFKLSSPGGLELNEFFGSSTFTTNDFNIDFECIDFIIEEDGNPSCFAEFTVCPPKPCETMINCDLEVAVSKIECSRQTLNSSYYITLDASNGNSYTMCYTVNDVPGSGINSAVPYNGIIGSYMGDQTIVVFLCPGGVCTLCLEPECYKVIKVYQPDCEEGDFGGVERISSNEPIINIQGSSEQLVKIIPNPVGMNKVSIVSKMAKTTFEIFDSKGQKIWNDSFTGETYTWEVSNLSSGNYILQYVDEFQQIQRIQFIKL